LLIPPFLGEVGKKYLRGEGKKNFRRMNVQLWFTRWLPKASHNDSTQPTVFATAFFVTLPHQWFCDEIFAPTPFRSCALVLACALFLSNTKHAHAGIDCFGWDVVIPLSLGFIAKYCAKKAYVHNKLILTNCPF
jgi:hypothetical protein